MKQYYYRTAGCPADYDTEAECICWHNIGTGPYPGATPDNQPLLGLSGLPLQLTWRDVPQEFTREIRYEVYKRKDIDKMPPAGRKKAHELFGELNALLDGYGVRARKCVVVESDWPEYEKVWQMIEERVSKHTHEIKFSLPPRVSPEEPSVTYTPPINLSKGESLKLTLACGENVEQPTNDNDLVLTTGELLAVDCRAAIPVDERIRYARAIEAAVLRKLVAYAIDEGDN